MFLSFGCAGGNVDPEIIWKTLCFYQGGEWVNGSCKLPTPNPEPTPTPTPEPTPTPTPTPTPPPEWKPPTAAQLAAAGKKVEIRPYNIAGKQIRVTPLAAFGLEYYCRAEVQWAEACNAGRWFGPVAPEGHAKRVEWENHFLGQMCATFSYESVGHMSFDPYIVRNEVNQNHPENIRHCGQTKFGGDPSWERDPQGYIKAGQWSWATAHGDGKICASAANGVGRYCIDYIEP
jgi:hypothetical protein